MSEVNLLILDWDRGIHGHVHGSDADRAIAALAAEPETIEELDVALRRFTDNRSHFEHFYPGDSDEPWDAGVVIIDLAARLIAGQSTYSAFCTEGSVCGPSGDEAVNFRLSDDWKVVCDFYSWRGTAKNRREQRTGNQRVDARQVMFGRPMLEFIAKNIAEARGLEAEEAVKKVHADWLLTARDDLAGKAPRELLLERHDFLGFDLQYRGLQWSASGKCPPGLDRDTSAYKYAGFGMHETVIYYDLMRHLLWECRQRLEDEGEQNRADEVLRLDKLRDAWLESPDPEFHDRTRASIIDNERRRIPEAVTGAEAAVDPDCPCCQMMAEDLGPYFWHLDGSNMDEDFAFSFYRTLEEWEEEQQRWEQFNREFEAQQQALREDRDATARIWNRTFTDEEFLDDLPLSQLVPVSLFGFAAMIGELNQEACDLADEKTGASRQETLNRLLGNLREALTESAELIDPALERLVNELADLADQYPKVGEKCADLSRRLQEFPAKLAASAKWDDIPF